MTLQELSDAYNALRNDALGRGLTPNVPAALASKVGNTFDRFKAWLANAGPLTDVVADAVALPWVNEYRGLATEVQAAGVKLSAPLPTTLGETVVSTASNVATFGKHLAFVLAAVAIPFTFILLGGARGRR